MVLRFFLKISDSRGLYIQNVYILEKFTDLILVQTRKSWV
jgi:hypothetical protein